MRFIFGMKKQKVREKDRQKEKPTSDSEKEVLQLKQEEGRGNEKLLCFKLNSVRDRGYDSKKEESERKSK